MNDRSSSIQKFIPHEPIVSLILSMVDGLERLELLRETFHFRCKQYWDPEGNEMWSIIYRGPGVSILAASPKAWCFQHVTLSAEDWDDMYHIHDVSEVEFNKQHWYFKCSMFLFRASGDFSKLEILDEKDERIQATFFPVE